MTLPVSNNSLFYPYGLSSFFTPEITAETIGVPPEISLPDILGRLLQFPSEMLRTERGEARLALVQELETLLCTLCPFYPSNPTERLESLLLGIENEDEVLRQITQFLMKLPHSECQRLSILLWEEGFSRADTRDQHLWDLTALQGIGDIAAHQLFYAIYFIRRLYRLGLLSIDRLGFVLERVRPHFSMVSSIERFTCLDQLAAIALDILKKPIQNQKTIEELFWLMQEIFKSCRGNDAVGMHLAVGLFIYLAPSIDQLPMMSVLQILSQHRQEIELAAGESLLYDVDTQVVIRTEAAFWIPRLEEAMSLASQVTKFQVARQFEEMYHSPYFWGTPLEKRVAYITLLRLFCSCKGGASLEALSRKSQEFAQPVDPVEIQALGALDIELLDWAIARTQKKRKAKSFCLCLDISSRLFLMPFSDSLLSRFLHIPALFVRLPPAEQTKPVIEKFTELSMDFCRALLPTVFFREYLKKIAAVKAEGLLEIQTELYLKAMERQPLARSKRKGRIEPPLEPIGLLDTIIKSEIPSRADLVRRLIEEPHMMVAIAGEDRMLLRFHICRLILSPFDDKTKSNCALEEILVPLRFLREHILGFGFDERHLLFNKALRAFCRCALDEQAFSTCFPLFIEMLDSVWHEYMVSTSRNLPPFLDIVFMKLLLCQRPRVRERGYIFCDAILGRLEKIVVNRARLENHRKDPFDHLSHRNETIESLVGVINNMVYDSTPAAWERDQTTQTFQQRIHSYEERLAAIHRAAHTRKFYPSPENDYSNSLMLSPASRASYEIIRSLIDKVEAETHPHALRKLFQILCDSVLIFSFEEECSLLELLDVASDIPRNDFHSIRVVEDYFDETVKHINRTMSKWDDRDCKRRCLHLYRIFNRFLIALAKPDSEDPVSQLRWFRQALRCLELAVTLGILHYDGSEHEKIVLQIFQDLENCLNKSRALREDEASNQKLIDLIDKVKAQDRI